MLIIGVQDPGHDLLEKFQGKWVEKVNPVDGGGNGIMFGIGQDKGGSSRDGSISSAVSASALEQAERANRHTAIQRASQILLIFCFIYLPPRLRPYRAFWPDDPLSL